MKDLALRPVLVKKPNSPDTWGLDPESEAKLSHWMVANLDLAIKVCSDFDSIETELVNWYTPPLNLTKCLQTADHAAISALRRETLQRVAAHAGVSTSASSEVSPVGKRFPLVHQPVSPRKLGRFASPPIGRSDTAEAIAARFGLNPKSYRQKLRDSISWYRKPQDWVFPVGSAKWKDMIRVAELMAGRR
jgi:hypothetical protein